VIPSFFYIFNLFLLQLTFNSANYILHLSLYRRIVLKWILDKQDKRCELNSVCSLLMFHKVRQSLDSFVSINCSRKKFVTELDISKIRNLPLRSLFEVFTAVKIQVEICRVVTPCIVVVVYHFKMEAARSSETLVSYRTTTRCHTQKTST